MSDGHTIADDHNDRNPNSSKMEKKENINFDADKLGESSGNVAKMQYIDESEVVQEMGITAKNATTYFVDDSQVVSNDTSHNASVDQAVTLMADPQMEQDTIIRFLQKPIVLTSGTFNITDTFSVFNSFAMPHALLGSGSTLATMWKEKLKGFFGIRFDLRFRVVTNANPFQQGRYIMAWIPLGGCSTYTSALKQLTFLQAHTATLVQRTTVKHVEIDLGSDGSAELVVPFSSVNAFYPVNQIYNSSDLNSLGYFAFYPYSPLQAPTGSTVAGYTIYVSMENVSLYGAASAEMGRKGQSSEQEISNKSNGPISGITKKISKGFKEFENIPLLGDLSRNVAWVADCVTGVASVFGFSKPTMGDSLSKMAIYTAGAHTTVDGDSDARALSYMSKPGTVPLEGLSGLDYDEMDFSYLKKIKAWTNTFTWAGADVKGAILSTISVRPSSGIVSVTVDTINYKNYVPFAFLANQFAYWRGSIIYTFKIVKTQYHSGRLEFAFFPTDETSNVSLSQYANRMIVDIREHSEVVLTVPYMSRTPWLTPTTRTGVLQVKVVDELVYPAAVSNTLDILVEMCAGDDFEVAAIGSVDEYPAFFTPQSFANANKIVEATIGDSTVRMNPVLMSSISIGDKVSSVRALLKRFTPTNVITPTGVNTGNGASIKITPDMLTSYSNYALQPSTLQSVDRVSLWGSCYTFMSGGVRIRDDLDYGMTNATAAYLNTSMSARIFTDTSTTITHMYENYTPVKISNNNFKVIQQSSLNNTITVEVPQYTKGFARACVDITNYQCASTSTTTRYNPDSTGSPFRLIISAPTGLTVTPVTNYQFHHVHRAGADDFNLSGFISVPPMITDFGSYLDYNY